MKLKIIFSLLIVVLASGILMSGMPGPLAANSHDLAKGKIVFQDKCSGCHGANGEGSFGPNLTDNYFIHGHHLHAVVHIVKHGNKKGMTAFHHHLSHKQIHDVAHYAFRLKGTNVAGGKAPQGKLHK
ncbi:MAG: c-type cytochrome [Bacteroidia bacterium]